MPIFGSFGGNPARQYGVFGAARANQVTGLTATNVGSGRAFNNGRIDLAWTAPGNNGAPITGYFIERSTNSGSTWSTLVSNTGNTNLSYSDTGLSSAQRYDYRVSAINAVGTGTASTAANATATTVPQAPTIGTATAGITSASVAFTAAATGGSAITTFTATSSPGSLTNAGATSPRTVTGLSVNTAYTFTVTATNANGTSAASAASNSVTIVSATLVDNFNRANGALGTSSDGLSSWSVVRENFTIDGSRAYSTSTNSALATVPLATSTVSSGYVDMVSDQGGVGLAVWASDANSYWGIYPHYTSTTNTQTTTTCTGPGFSGTGPTTCSSSQNVSGTFGPYRIDVYAYEDQQYLGRTACADNCAQPAWSFSYPNVNFYCSPSTECNPNGGYNFTTNTNASNVTTTNSVTNYTSAMRINSANGVVVNNQYAANLSPMRSIDVSTSGNVITYRGYSAAAKGGSVLVNSTYDAGAGTKANKFGVFKASSPHAQGSYVDNINITVV